MAAGAALQLQDASVLTDVYAPMEVIALPEVFALVEKANLQALSASLQFKDLYDEVSILQRLAYKNNNQHRSSKHYQAVRQVLKVLQLFQQMQLPTLLQHLHTAAARTSLPEAPTAGSSTKRARRQQQQQHAAAQRQTVRLPSFQAGCFILRRLLSGAQLLLDLHYVILSAGQHLSGQLSRGYFMPFCLVAAAAVARIRVLATAGLLELLQAYNSLAQLLPLLPLLPAATPAAASTTNTSSSSSSSSSSSFQAVNSDGLPQMLQLAWNGPLPALRSIPFEQQGPQSLQALAAELQETYCISSSSSSSSGGGNRDSHLAAGQLGGADPHGTRQQSAAGVQAAGGDVGMAISREAFALQLGQQQQQQQTRQRLPLQSKQRAPRQPQQQQQQGSAPAFSISFFEDKQPQQAANTDYTAAGDHNGTSVFPQQPSVAVPLYSTVPGLGFSLGQQHKPCVPVALGTAAAAASGQVVAVPENSSTVDSVRGPQAMEVDELTAEDQQDFVSLYGKQPTPTQQQQQQQQQQPQHQQQQQQQTGIHGTTAGQPAAATGAAVGVHWGLQASAGLLAMQQCHSSDDDEDMGVVQPLAVVAAAVAGCGLTLPGVQAVQQQQQQQQQQSQGQLALQQQQQQQQQQVAEALPASESRPHGLGQGHLQGQRASRQSSQPAAAALAQMPPQPASAAAPQPAAAAPAVVAVLDLASAAAGGSSSRQTAGKGGPVLQASNKSKQKKKGKQPAAEAPQDAPAAPRDSILDMLLQGL